jgi:glycosyltransferase involved in cell wall biosynthesis
LLVITAIVTTFNEEHNIEKCLRSVQWADEILIVDSFSTDRTIEICEQYGARVLQRVYKYPADQKNWAIPQAKNPWIILFDADEVAETSMKEEIEQLLEADLKYTAYWIRRKNYFLGKRVRFCGWQNDRVIRFFKRDLHKYENKMVHEEIERKGEIGKMKSVFFHHTAVDIGLYTEKIKRYANYSAQEIFMKKKRVNAFHLYVKPAHKFIVSYIIRGGFLDGKTGWIICRLRAKETWLKAKNAIQLFKNL